MSRGFVFTICMPHNEPFPTNSRKKLITVSAKRNPTPMPRPSAMEGSTLLLLANISARARMDAKATIS